MSKTHDVLNQPPPLVNFNLYTTDLVLMEAVKREGASWAEEKLKKFGALMGSAEVIDWGRVANENKPILHTHDRFGNRIDQVEFHPAWHELMKLSMEYGIHTSPWSDPKSGAHVARAAVMMLDGENEYGHGCPISMTYAVVPALRKQPNVFKQWEKNLFTNTYDPRFLPHSQKKGVLMGMAMTEKQGGSDVRANTTQAVPIGKNGPGEEYLLTGHKWFCSAPMNDAFLTLAQAPGGLSCFLLPRFKPDGTKNNFFIQRLKDKLGNRSNASSEIELENAWAQMVGEEGRGVPTIIEMANHTRLDCVIGSTAMARQAIIQAIHHCNHREAFGKKLVEQSLMKNVLADLSIESEAMTVLMMRLARAYDYRGTESSLELPFRRIATAISKYWICKRAPTVVGEALECLGGGGYVEESILPRLYRDTPLNSIWEGSGNVICLDVLRALKKEEGTLQALMTEINLGVGSDKRLDIFVEKLSAELKNPADIEIRARHLVEQIGLALQGSLLVRFSSQEVADAFCASRLDNRSGHTFGTLPASTDFSKIIRQSFEF